MSYYTAGGKEKPDTTAYLAARKAGTPSAMPCTYRG